MTGKFSDFSIVASRYDATRHVPEQVLTSCYEMLMERGVMPSVGTILDAGCGTGQISVPLLDFGLQVLGIDVSESMVRIANSKVKPGQKACYEVGDVRSTGFSDRHFDGAVFSKLMMHVEDWRRCCDELIRVSKSGSYIVHLIDRGTFADSARREFTRQINQLGFEKRFLGAVSWSGEIPAYMSSLGCEVHTFQDDRQKWKRYITRRHSLDALKERLFAEFWYLPIETYDRVLSDTTEWSKAQPGGLDDPECLAGYLVIESFKTP